MFPTLKCYQNPINFSHRQCYMTQSWSTSKLHTTTVHCPHKDVDVEQNDSERNNTAKSPAAEPRLEWQHSLNMKGKIPTWGFCAFICNANTLFCPSSFIAYCTTFYWQCVLHTDVLVCVFVYAGGLFACLLFNTPVLGWQGLWHHSHPCQNDGKRTGKREKLSHLFTAQRRHSDREGNGKHSLH